MKTNTKSSTSKEIRNYIHNSLGLTKDEVKEIVREGIKEEVSNYINQELCDKEKWEFFIESHLQKIILDSADTQRYSYLHCTVDKLYHKIDEEIHNEVLKRLSVSLKPMDDQVAKTLSTTPITIQELQDIVSQTYNLTKKDKQLSEILEILNLKDFII
jgi:hypothetical protein